MIEYFFPLLLLCVIQSGTPGPNNIMLTASGKNFGYVKTIPHMAGVIFGFLTLLIVMGLGLISIFTSYPIDKLSCKYWAHYIYCICLIEFILLIALITTIGQNR